MTVTGNGLSLVAGAGDDQNMYDSKPIPASEQHRQRTTGVERL
jgi:hypothetical protein